MHAEPTAPTVANGVVYAGANYRPGDFFRHTGPAHAFDARGHDGCSGSPTTCSPLWSAPSAGEPIVTDGHLYQIAGDGSFFR